MRTRNYPLYDPESAVAANGIPYTSQPCQAALARIRRTFDTVPVGAADEIADVAGRIEASAGRSWVAVVAAVGEEDAAV